VASRVGHALNPVLTIIGLQFSFLAGGVDIIEQVFLSLCRASDGVFQSIRAGS